MVWYFFVKWLGWLYLWYLFFLVGYIEVLCLYLYCEYLFVCCGLLWCYFGFGCWGCCLCVWNVLYGLLVDCCVDFGCVDCGLLWIIWMDVFLLDICFVWDVDCLWRWVILSVFCRVKLDFMFMSFLCILCDFILIIIWLWIIFLFLL